MKKTISNSICKNIKKYRLLNKMTQEELSALLDLDTQYYAQLERGERNFTIEKITRICSILRVGIDDIIEIESTNADDTEELKASLENKIKNLSRTQLIVLDRFVDNTIPYIK